VSGRLCDSADRGRDPALAPALGDEQPWGWSLRRQSNQSLLAQPISAGKRFRGGGDRAAILRRPCPFQTTETGNCRHPPKPRNAPARCQAASAPCSRTAGVAHCPRDQRCCGWARVLSDRPARCFPVGQELIFAAASARLFAPWARKPPGTSTTFQAGGKKREARIGRSFVWAHLPITPRSAIYTILRI
jgi:hypothetical protein